MADIQIKTTEPETVAYIPMKGSYSQVPMALGRLYGWIGQHGLQPVGMPACVYMTDPALGEASAEWEARAPVAGVAAESPVDDSGCGIKHVAPRLVATIMYKGPYESVADTYGELAQWIDANGYRISGPPEELYYSDPSNTAPEDYLTEIRFTVAEK